ncbi:hypothetical protein PTSG_12407 [Salpingoeca rosetta]|uniref:Carbohydrate kinase PfkB domain-containing protein n=1 Tax=Salpingoeca rosetta (strain ATCC 50818 / BSB-021) TaxID=946362 RepID=F2UC55_SALR5|nr:uncharacterized protein PTSG_12407 [Salpingoeca rosetta]EGD74162.1 hypothetical protein PTSG_12407 [Salpingoeca rosetta]|eukprot:XP_004993062.1 hypothetical protein PTSG_12407 [Salpingoeca rosetta]
MRVVAFGEAMVRYAPMAVDQAPEDPNAQVMLRSIGGDELNVCVALARLRADEQEGEREQSTPAPQWVSVLPTGPLGDLVYRSGDLAGVDQQFVLRIPGADVGTFTVLPELKRVHYQRQHSAFALHDPSQLDWDKILGGSDKKWLHMTGITPMISENSYNSWTRAMMTAIKRRIPISIDFNHRKQLGTLSKLWSIMVPHLQHVELLILSVASLLEIVDQELPVLRSHVPAADTPYEDAAWGALMRAFQHHVCVRRLAVCFKTRDETGLQKRWSVIASDAGVHNTLVTPVYHRPKDECGGGSAWAAGMLDWFSLHGHDNSPSLTAAARHADILAAMCQETQGDHSQVTRAQLSSVEAQSKGKPLNIETLDTSTNDVETRLDATMAKLRRAGVIAILRAKNPDAAIARGLELCDMGCRAIEVTLDTVNWRRVLAELAAKVPSHVCVGVGTVMDVDVPIIKDIAALGAAFALSPIEPKGFIDECHKHGVLAVPAGMTSNELWDMHRRGARVIKLFHASMLGPRILKSMLSVSPLRQMNIAPSGGCSPDNAHQWWDAGAFSVGMGANLTGKDIVHPAGSAEYEQGRRHWEEQGREVAKQLFVAVQSRFR